jgi:hypothetical protein
MTGCKMQQNKNEASSCHISVTQKTKFLSTLPHIVIYKTSNDYRYNVPVILSDDKSQIVSYPHPTDLFFDNELTLPIQLDKGYLLDNRGIGKNVAFLSYTYEEYSRLKFPPSLEKLYKNIIDKDPLVELWNCGTREEFSDLRRQLNELINKNMLSVKGKRIK